MKFYSHYNALLNRLMKEAEGDALPPQEGLPQGNPGEEPNPEELPTPEDGQELASPFELTMANFVLQLYNLDPNDTTVKSLAIDKIEPVMEQNSSNPTYLLNFTKSLYKEFKSMVNLDVSGLKHSESNNLEEHVKNSGAYWAKALLNALKALRSPNFTVPEFAKNGLEIKSEDLENFKQELNSYNF